MNINDTDTSDPIIEHITLLQQIFRAFQTLLRGDVVATDAQLEALVKDGCEHFKQLDINTRLEFVEHCTLSMYALCARIARDSRASIQGALAERDSPTQPDAGAVRP